MTFPRGAAGADEAMMLLSRRPELATTYGSIIAYHSSPPTPTSITLIYGLFCGNKKYFPPRGNPTGSTQYYELGVKNPTFFMPLLFKQAAPAADTSRPTTGPCRTSANATPSDPPTGSPPRRLPRFRRNRRRRRRRRRRLVCGSSDTRSSWRSTARRTADSNPSPTATRYRIRSRAACSGSSDVTSGSRRGGGRMPASTRRARWCRSTCARRR